VVSISIGRKRDGQPKDTAVNILQRKNFVIHIARTDEVATLNQTAAPLARGESEVTANALKTEAVAGWPLPRLAGASVALCGKLYAAHAIGANTLILGEIRAVWLDDELGAQAEEDGSVRPTPEALQPLARLGGTLYAPLGDRIDVPRPS